MGLADKCERGVLAQCQWEPADAHLTTILFLSVSVFVTGSWALSKSLGFDSPSGTISSGTVPGGGWPWRTGTKRSVDRASG